jgi:hypothetical protein
MPPKHQEKTTMKRALLAASVLAVGVLLAVASLGAPPVGDAPAVPSLASLMQKEIHWGMAHSEVVTAYNRPTGLFDREYAPQMARLQPGVEMDELQADRDSRKVNFERSYTEFTDSPTGYDIGALHGEYSYKNEEAIQHLFKDGRNRYFFYIKDHLWKVYDEVPLKADGPLGGSYKDAVAKLGAVLGAPARARPADASRGVDRPTADWQDGSTHLRAIDRSGEHLIGIVLEDKRTLSNLASLRSNKPQDPFALDPSITALTRHGISDPNAARAEDADAGASKHKKH